MSDHAWMQQNLDAYALGGLSAEERESIVQHLASCPECERALDELRDMEKLMDRVFADARPAAGLEERVIQRLRRAMRSRPDVYRFIAAAAAVLVLGVLGFTLQALLDGDGAKKKDLVAATRLKVEHPAGIVGHIDHFALENRAIARDDISFMEQYNLPILTERYKEMTTDAAVTMKVTAEESLKSGGGKLLHRGNEVSPLPPPPERGWMADFKDPRKLYRAQGDDLYKEARGRTYAGDQLDVAEIQKNLEKQFDLGKSSEKGKGEGMPHGEQPRQRESKAGNEPMVTAKKPGDNGYFPFGDKDGKDLSYFGMPVEPNKTTPPSPSLPTVIAPPPVTPPPPVKRDDKPPEEESPKPTKTPAPEQKQPEPEPAGRKIIKSGDMEFEVQSFDQAVEAIKDVLRKKTKNTGFVASINSDKLPNGKMRGTMIVRMAPQVFEDFPNEVRDALVKMGTLRCQHIGSQDVTKAYTDIESELRAARAIEERFLLIIKSGKGEIKDLIAAERELGIWRTKIEKMEGEIRFYNNLISLSTLTIQINEKELQAAVALVMRERVQMNIEVDDVDAKQLAVMTLVRKAKGRILKSELKRADAGQMIAEIHAEVPPNPPEDLQTFRKALKDLGKVTRHHAERTQQSEGGTGKVSDIKEREEDVRFEISLYNTANIKPRETMHLRWAYDNVATVYDTLKKAITKMNGQIRVAHLNEEDKTDVKAELDFNVPDESRDAIETLIKKEGFELKRHSVQAAVNEMSTDRKVGYRLELRSTDAIPPKERFRYGLTVDDVPANHEELLKHVSELGGRIQRSPLDEQDKYNIRGELTFDIPKDKREAFDKLLKKSGAVLIASDQTPPQIDSTERKVGYSLFLRSFSSMQPRETLTISLAATDVIAAHTKLDEKIADLIRARVFRSHLVEHDPFNVSAVLDFDVNKTDRDKIEDLLKKLGTVITRSNAQAEIKSDATDRRIGYKLTIRSVNSIGPKDIYQIQIASPNVKEHYQKLYDAATRVKAKVIHRQLNEEDHVKVHADLEFVVNAGDQAAIEKLIADAGATTSRATNQAGPKDEATELKVGYQIKLRNAAGAEPRERTALQIQVVDVNQAALEFKSAAQAVKGRIIDSKFDRFENGKVEAFLVFEVPLAVADNLVKQFRAAGHVEKHQTAPNKNVPENPLSTAHLIVKLTTAGPILPSDEGLGEQMRRGLYSAFWIFSRVMIFILTGIAGLVPLLLTVWIAAKVIAWAWPTRVPTPTLVVEAPKAATP